jgi:secreted PhoX family phosphatase
MGLFTHEAVAVDPDDRRCYLTEDAGGDDLPGRFLWGRFYRFTPTRWRDDGRGVLDLGLLEAMVVQGDPYDGDGPWDVSWRAVDPLATTVTSRLVGATPFDGGEGCWYDSGRVYFTTKGDNRVWAVDVAAQQLELLYDAARLGDDPPLRGVDNVTVSPFGDIFVAEDGGNMELVAMSEIAAQLEVTPFLRIVGQDGSEIAGPAFHPDGTRLYLSSQRGAPGRGRGLTYEVTGPFG